MKTDVVQIDPESFQFALAEDVDYSKLKFSDFDRSLKSSFKLAMGFESDEPEPSSLEKIR